MNEFTKEELEWLKEELEIGIQEYVQPPIAYSIHEKILFLIENYCDHKYTQSAIIHTQTTGYGNRCIKCKKFV